MNKPEYLALRKKLNFTLSSRDWLVTMVTNLTLTGIACTLLFSASVFANFFAIPVLAVLFFRSFSWMHEAVHGTANPHRKLNELTGFYAGLFCFLDYGLWKDLHIKHHYWTGNYHQDPALGLIKNYRSLPNWVQRTLDFCWKHKIPFGALIQHVVFWTQSFLISKKSRSSVASLTKTLAPLALNIIFALTLSGPSLVAYLLGIGLYLYAVEIVNFPHHVGLYTETSEQRVNVWEQDHYARSCKYPAWIEKYIVLNFNYHVEHHLFPDLPWTQLPIAYQELSNHHLGHHPHQAEQGWISSRRNKKFIQFLEIDDDSIRKNQDQVA